MNIITLIFVCLFVANDFSYASELRCNGTIVKPGMTTQDVETMCGSPVAKDSFENVYKEVTKDNKEKNIYEPREMWVFDLDSGSNLRIISFARGQVRSIQELDQRGLDQNARTSKCEKSSSSIHNGIERIMVKYYCGNPENSSVVSDDFTLDNGYKIPDGKVSRRVRTEQWNYRTNGKELRITLTDNLVSGIEAM